MSLEQNHSQFQENLKMLMVKSSLDDLQNIRRIVGVKGDT